jgi:hypothetical protein
MRPRFGLASARHVIVDRLLAHYTSLCVFASHPQYFKFSTTWTYENEIQPVAARAINVEFTLFNPNGDSEVPFSLLLPTDFNRIT